MIDTLPRHSSIDREPAFAERARDAARRIPPLWPLSRFVAVNPFVGLANRSFDEACALLARTAGTTLAMPPAFYRERFEHGEISGEDIDQAIVEAGELAPSGTPQPSRALIQDALLREEWFSSASESCTPLFSGVLDRTLGTRWSVFVVEEVSKCCAAYFDQGQALWKMPWNGLPLFTAWRRAALIDRNPEAAGLAGCRKYFARLPEDPLEVIAHMAAQLGIPDASAADVFHRLLLSVSGWAGHLQFLAHEKKLRGGDDDTLLHLLAMRLAFEGALHSVPWGSHVLAEWTRSVTAESPVKEDVARFSPERIWQRAHECAMQRNLFGRLAAPIRQASVERPAFQAVFCIDVRSEVIRRALEAEASDAQTIGFAGFFGFPIEAIPAGETHGTAQCPVLLSPAARVEASIPDVTLVWLKVRKQAASSWRAFKSSAVSSFVFVDAAGISFGARLARDLAHRHETSICSPCGVDTSAIPLADRVAMAAGSLRHLGFASGGLSRLVLLCGHGSQTENNPYGSSLDCGACGGHTGESNARTAASILNHPEVRAGLEELGILVPADTWFLAGLHNTTTDDVTLFDTDRAPSTHAMEIARLESVLAAAGHRARRERAPNLELAANSPDLASRIRTRGRDWSQVRPEWGLAGNYAFIAAPRKRTLGLDLSGRVFLHDYRYAADPGEATLELLLAAPVVVASWINLQYFASTVDNARFGSGNKVLHNVVGGLGALEGNGGDLRVGLPIQSLHDGRNWRHEPLRLTVCVEAPREAMDRVLVKHPEVADLVANEWIYLFAMDSSGRIMGKSNGRGSWS